LGSIRPSGLRNWIQSSRCAANDVFRANPSRWSKAAFGPSGHGTSLPHSSAVEWRADLLASVYEFTT